MTSRDQIIYTTPSGYWCSFCGGREDYRGLGLFVEYAAFIEAHAACIAKAKAPRPECRACGAGV